MACGMLPAIDRQVCGFERWLAVHLAGIADNGPAQAIRRFASWEVLPTLRARARKNPISAAVRRHADDQIKPATACPMSLT
jgi:hypothetical protein